METQLAFDTVNVQQEDGTILSYDAQEFVNLPVHERVKFILENRLFFFAGPEMVDNRLAMKSLRLWSAQKMKRE